MGRRARVQAGEERIPYGDVGLVLGVPILLVLFHAVLSPRTKQALFYDPADPDLLGLYGSSLVHTSTGHLVGNLLGFTLLGVLGYAFVVWIEERRWFRLAALTTLLVTPVLVNLTDTLVLRTVAPGLLGPVAGFSSVVAAFGGLTVAFYLGLVRRVSDTRASVAVGGTVVVLLLEAVQVIYVPDSLATASAIALALGAILALDLGWRFVVSDGLSIPSEALGITLLGGFTLLLVLGVLVVVLFPPEPFGSPVVTNVFSHAHGFAYGLVIGIWGHRYWTDLDWLV